MYLTMHNFKNLRDQLSFHLFIFFYIRKLKPTDVKWTVQSHKKLIKEPFK